MCPVIKDLFFNRNRFSSLIKAHTKKQEHKKNSAIRNTSEKALNFRLGKRRYITNAGLSMKNYHRNNSKIPDLNDPTMKFSNNLSVHKNINSFKYFNKCTFCTFATT